MAPCNSFAVGNDLRSTPYLVESAANALRLIGIIRSSGTLTVTQAASELGVSKATAHRLLSTLVSEDYALRDPVHRRYHPGGVMLQWSSSSSGSEERNRLRRPLERLSARLGETIKLHVLDGIHVRSIEVVEGTQTVRVGAAVGELAPANATAAGKLLLSLESEEDLRERFRGKLPRRSEQTMVDWNEFMVELQLVRQRKYAVNFGESTSGVNGLSVPVKSPEGEMVAALTLAAPASRFSRADHEGALGPMLSTAGSLDVGLINMRSGNRHSLP